MSEEYKKIHDEYFEKGIQEGIEKAKEESYNNGFRDGVQRGIEIGIFQQFLITMKDILSKDNESGKFNKIINMIEKCDMDNFDDLQNKCKAVKMNIKVLNKRKNE